MRKTIILFVAALAALGLSIAVPAQSPDGVGGPPETAGHMHHGGPFAHELRQLDLSAAQKTSIKQFVHAAMPQMRAEREALHAQRKAFDAAVPGSADYQATADSLAEAAATAARNHVQQEAALRAQIYPLLTNAQKTRLATLLAQREAKIEAWRDRHHPEDAPQG